MEGLKIPENKLVTREELYKQVWETPMSKLGKEYGLTDNGLRKICDRLNVPYPPRGYWAKKAAGQKVATYKLPAHKEGTPKDSYIRPTPPQELMPPEVKEAVAAAKAKNPEIFVPEKLVKPHPVIAKWLRDYDERWERYRKDRDPFTRNLWKPADFTESDRRMHRILHGLFKALEAKGASIKEDERGDLVAEIQGEKIEFKLREKSKQVHRPLTAEEKKYSWNEKKDTKYDLMPTGKLAFSIKTYLPNKLQREWIESNDKSMEVLLADIVATILASVPLLVEKAKQRQEEELQRQIESNRRYEEEQRQKLENHRWRRFMEMAQQWREAEVASGFITALKQLPMDEAAKFGGKDMAEWTAWAEEQLISRNPLNKGAERIWDSVSKVTTWTYNDR